MRIRWHHHQWWLVGALEYTPPNKPDSAMAITVLTYVCRGDYAHVKQVVLRGRQKGTVDAILSSQQQARREVGQVAIPPAPRGQEGE